MKIGFLSNQLDNRGTGNALFNYAYYNKTLLGNDSAIFTYSTPNNDEEAVAYFSHVFGGINVIDGPDDVRGVDALYHIKSGAKDGFNIDIPYLVHSVFDNDPHGTRYATISEWMAARLTLPFVPHIVDLPEIEENLRESFGIPDGAIVYGRYGGMDTFDIPWVWSAINRVLAVLPNVYFLFMNTAVPDVDFFDAKRVIFLGATVNPKYKRIFINTCDAMIHARFRGETFGLAVGEFAFCGKPIFTYEESPEKAHIYELRQWGVYYTDEETLFAQFISFNPEQESPRLYIQFSPINVMRQFDEVFLSGLA